MVAQLLARRKPKRASVLLPNAAMQAAKQVGSALSMITWYMEVVITTAETGTLLPHVQVHHKFKGNGKNPE